MRDIVKGRIGILKKMRRKINKKGLKGLKWTSWKVGGKGWWKIVKMTTFLRAGGKHKDI